MLNFIRAFRRLPHALTPQDKTLLTGICLVILLTGGFWWKSLSRLWLTTPVKGGVYTEGISSHNAYDLDQVIAKLTKIGLTYVDRDNHLHGALADHWDIANAGKTYTFFLRPGVDNKLVANIYAASPNWQNIAITTGPDNSLIMNLKQPFAPLLAFSGDPLVELGPYVKTKQTKNEITLSANKSFILGEPNLQKVILIIYPDEKSLKAALQRQEITGADVAIKQVPGTRIHTLRLTKQTALIFNLDRPMFKDKKIRQQVRDHQKLEKPITATLVTDQDPRLLDLANQFSQQALTLGLTVSVKSLNTITLTRDALANDNYDLLLTDLNYGYDEDPYPYWHSSQVLAPGQNYAGYNSKEADKLIEDARQTLDETQRQKKYQEFQNILNQDVPAIFYPTQVFTYTLSDRIKGVGDGSGAVPADRFTGVWQWFIKAKRQPSG